MTATKARAIRRRRGSVIEVPGAKGVSYKLKFDAPGERDERRTFYKTLKGVTREEAEAELARLVGQSVKTDLSAGKQPLATWIETWIELDHDVSTRTLERYGELLRSHVAPRIGLIDRLTPAAE